MCRYDKWIIHWLFLLKTTVHFYTQIPVYKGAKNSILGTRINSTFHHGDDGLGGQPDPTPPSRQSVQPEHAAIAMIDIVNKHPGG